MNEQQTKGLITNFFVRFKDNLTVSSLSNFRRSNQVAKRLTLNDKFTCLLSSDNAADASSSQLTRAELRKSIGVAKLNLLGWSLEDNSSTDHIEDELFDSNNSDQIIERPLFDTKAIKRLSMQTPCLDQVTYLNESNKHLLFNDTWFMQHLEALNVNRHFKNTLMGRKVCDAFKHFELVDELISKTSSISQSLTTSTKCVEEVAFSPWRMLKMLTDKKLNDLKRKQTKSIESQDGARIIKKPRSIEDHCKLKPTKSIEPSTNEAIVQSNQKQIQLQQQQPLPVVVNQNNDLNIFDDLNTVNGSLFEKTFIEQELNSIGQIVNCDLEIELKNTSNALDDTKNQTIQPPQINETDKIFDDDPRYRFYLKSLNDIIQSILIKICGFNIELIDYLNGPNNESIEQLKNKRDLAKKSFTKFLLSNDQLEPNHILNRLTEKVKSNLLEEKSIFDEELILNQRSEANALTKKVVLSKTILEIIDFLNAFKSISDRLKSIELNSNGLNNSILMYLNELKFELNELTIELIDRDKATSTKTDERESYFDMVFSILKPLSAIIKNCDANKSLEDPRKPKKHVESIGFEILDYESIRAESRELTTFKVHDQHQYVIKRYLKKEVDLVRLKKYGYSDDGEILSQEDIIEDLDQIDYTKTNFDSLLFNTTEQQTSGFIPPTPKSRSGSVSTETDISTQTNIDAYLEFHDKAWNEKDLLTSEKIREILGDPTNATFKAFSESLENLFDYNKNNDNEMKPSQIQPLMSLNVPRPPNLNEAAQEAQAEAQTMENQQDLTIQKLSVEQTRLVISKLVYYQNLSKCLSNDSAREILNRLSDMFNQTNKQFSKK